MFSTLGLILAAAYILLTTAVSSSSSSSSSNQLQDEGSQLRSLLQEPTHAPLIFGGEEAKKGRFPYIVSLRNSIREHKCGGILIRKQWVLTAAHCFDGGPSGFTRNPFLLIGGHGLSDTEEDKNVKGILGSKVIIHEKYTNYAEGNDIALIKLATPVKKKDFANLPLPGSEFGDGLVLIALGWGRTEEGTLAQTLKQAELEYLSAKSCQDRWVDTDIKDSMICTVSNEQRTCQGDSGGPLVEANTLNGSADNGNSGADILVGITSFGLEECSDLSKPTVYTSVTSFLPWILEKMSGSSAPTLTPAEQSPTVGPTSSRCLKLYTVAPGDTCYKLWLKHALTEENFRSLNPNLGDVCILSIGQKLCLG